MSFVPSAAVLEMVAGADGEVGGEVLEQVADAALDDQAEQHAPLDVLVGVLRLGAERGHRLEPDQQQDGDRRLVQHVHEAVRDDHLPGVGQLEGLAGVAEPVDDEDDADGEQRHDLDDVDDDGGHRRPADAPVGDVADDRWRTRPRCTPAGTYVRLWWKTVA